MACRREGRADALPPGFGLKHGSPTRSRRRAERENARQGSRAGERRTVTGAPSAECQRLEEGWVRKLLVWSAKASCSCSAILDRYRLALRRKRLLAGDARPPWQQAGRHVAGPVIADHWRTRRACSRRVCAENFRSRVAVQRMNPTGFIAQSWWGLKGRVRSGLGSCRHQVFSVSPMPLSKADLY